jgi:transcriptional regulator with XRE-family HTH domain
MVRRFEEADVISQLIAENIRNARMESGLSRDQLAKQIGVTHQQLQKYENCKNKISAGRLALLAIALNKPISFFYKNIEVGLTNEFARITLEASRNLLKCSPEQQTIVNNIIKELLKIEAQEQQKVAI